MKSPETLSEWNRRRAKEGQRMPRMKQLADNPGKPDFDRIVANCAKYYAEPTFVCPSCLDTGFVIETRIGPGKIYGKAAKPTVYSLKCSCRSNTRRSFKPQRLEDIPI
ncbi:MAG: hypothetical protein E4H01_04475 [Lysobacterales bacterium]|nr:MAG: hypothetical protein E4H01_04475 [Xanthomonadales bacterium]